MIYTHQRGIIRRLESRPLLTACLCLGAGVCTLSACGSSPVSSAIPEYELGSPRVLISQTSALLAQPLDLALDSAGNLYVLDQMDRRVLVVTPDGEILDTIGRPGSGPGEFGLPFALGIDNDGRLRIFDYQRASVQVMSHDGDYLTEYPADILGVPTRLSFSTDGRLAYFGPRVAGKGGLVAVLDGSGRETSMIGDLISEDYLIPPNLLDELHRRRLPNFMRNTALPIFDSNGGLWLFLQTEAALQHFGPDGSLVRQATLNIPEMRTIEQDYFNWYEDIETDGILRYFEYVEDGLAVGASIWLLWYTPDDQPGLVTVHDEAGNATARLILRGMEMDAGRADPREGARRRRFIVDPHLSQLYVTDQRTLTVRAYSIPTEVTHPR